MLRRFALALRLVPGPLSLLERQLQREEGMRMRRWQHQKGLALTKIEGDRALEPPIL